MESIELASKRTAEIEARDKMQGLKMMVQRIKKLAPECRGLSKSQIKKHEFDVGCKFALNIHVSFALMTKYVYRAVIVIVLLLITTYFLRFYSICNSNYEYLFRIV